MVEVLAALVGILVSIMVTMNDALAKSVGVYGSSIVIHCVGTAACALILLATRRRIGPLRGIPVYELFVGLIGISHVVFFNIVIPHIGVAVSSGASLVGQIVASMIFDATGALGVKKVRLPARRFAGAAVMLCGIACMLYL